MTDLFFGLKQSSLILQTFQAGVLVEQQRAEQNGIAPDVGRFRIFALDSADRTRPSFSDRTWVDRGEGIGIIDGDDATFSQRKRIEGNNDEALGIQVGGFTAKTAILALNRVSSQDGAQFRIKAFNAGLEVDSQVIAIPGNGNQTLHFNSHNAFDEVQISAADDDTRFTFRSINLPEATPKVLSFGQQAKRRKFQVVEDGNSIDQVKVRQNAEIPSLDRFTVSAVDSLDSGRKANFVDRTFFDRSVGVGIADGDDGNSFFKRKRIDGDEILGISFEDTLTTDALINVGRVDSVDGAAIKVEAFREGVSVAAEVFTLGSGSLSNVDALAFGSTHYFDSLQLSAADADTQFSFRRVDLPGAFVV